MSARLKILFASTHGYIDPSSGAAICTRDILELLAAAGHDCRVLSAGVLDYDRPTPLSAVLEPVGLADQRATAQLSNGRAIDVYDFTHQRVRATLVPTASSRANEAPAREEGAAWLDLGVQVLERFRPDVVLTYGGHPASLELMKRARQRGIPVVFHMHNMAYDDRRALADASVLLFPSEFARRHYRKVLGRDGPVLPDPLRPERVVAEDPDPTYVTFVNPQMVKGVTVFARIAHELDRRRPEIPLLVVEGRGGSEWLARLPIDLSGLRNLNRMANTTEPKDFWRVTRIVLMPSLWKETLGRVAMEGLANGVPVLASDRGALPETLGNAGFVFTVPERYTPENPAVPTAREVAPWVAIIERLWDDPGFETEHRERALQEAKRWEPRTVTQAYVSLFRSVASAETTVQT
jgi:glycosyltransferase involved in cell wall biosynthesis